MDYQKFKLKEIIPDGLYDKLNQTESIIAGGAITSIFCNREINDIDVYVRNQKALVTLLAYLYSNAHLISLTSKAALFRYTQEDEPIDIQVIFIDYYANARDLFDDFDFTVCMGAYDFKDEGFDLAGGFLEDNASRTLTFNSSTKFPLVSALRVMKYQTKGYTISKAEYMRVIMTCMNLSITSFEGLKEHLGGMYGINLDKLFNESEEFSLNSAIGQLAELYKNPNYAEYNNIHNTTKCDSFEDFIIKITTIDFKYDGFIINGNTYYLDYENKIKAIRDEVKDSVKIIPTDEFLAKHKFYKQVKNDNGKLTSFFDPTFEYHIEKVAEAFRKDVGLFFTINDIPRMYTKKYDNAVVLELEIKAEDFLIDCWGVFTAKKLYVKRIIE